jgi:hypothetical protein
MKRISINRRQFIKTTAGLTPELAEGGVWGWKLSKQLKLF